MLGFSSSTTCHNYPTILHNESPEEIAQLKTYRSDAGSALDEGRAALASAMTTGGTGSSMTSTLASTAVKTGTLTFWSYLAFQEYLAVAAGKNFWVVGFRGCAPAVVFLWFLLAPHQS